GWAVGALAGAWSPFTLFTMVTVSGLSGLTNAYRSVLSIFGFSAVNGASLWLDATPAVGPRPANRPAPNVSVAPRAIAARRTRLPRMGTANSPFFGDVLRRWMRTINRRALAPAVGRPWSR